MQIQEKVELTEQFYNNRTPRTGLKEIRNRSNGIMHQDVVSGWQLPPNIRSLKNDANAIRRMLRSKGLEELMNHNTETDYAKVTKLHSTSYLLLFSNTDLDWSNCLSFCMFISPSCWLAVYGTCGKMIISLCYARYSGMT